MRRLGADRERTGGGLDLDVGPGLPVCFYLERENSWEFFSAFRPCSRPYAAPSHKFIPTRPRKTPLSILAAPRNENQAHEARGPSLRVLHESSEVYRCINTPALISLSHWNLTLICHVSEW